MGTRGYPSYYGGFETAVRHLAPHLADNGWAVRVYGRARTASTSESGDTRVRTIYTPGIESKSLSTLTFGFTAAIHAVWQRPDVVLIMNVANCLWLPVLKLRRIPAAVNVDGIEWERAKWGLLARATFRLGASITARFAERIVVDAQAIGNYWAKTYGREGCYIPYGGTAPSGQLPVEDGLKQGGYILLVARLVPENSIDAFLDAVPLLKRTAPVVIAGTSGYADKRQMRVQQMAERGDIIWLRHISDDRRLHGLWQHAGIYFHGHSVGGTNPSLVQAMACGAPTVARDTVYNREVLANAGVYVDDTPTAIAEAIIALMEDDEARNTMSATAGERALQHFTWTKVNQAYAGVLAGLIATGQ